MCRASDLSYKIITSLDFIQTTNKEVQAVASKFDVHFSFDAGPSHERNEACARHIKLLTHALMRSPVCFKQNSNGVSSDWKILWSRKNREERNNKLWRISTSSFKPHRSNLIIQTSSFQSYHSNLIIQTLHNIFGVNLGMKSKRSRGFQRSKLWSSCPAFTGNYFSTE